METKPWYLSKTLWLQVVSMAVSITAGFGMEFSAEQVAAITGLVVPVLTLIDRLFFTKTKLTA